MTQLQKAALSEHAYFDEESCKAEAAGDEERAAYYRRIAEDALRQAYAKEQNR